MYDGKLPWRKRGATWRTAIAYRIARDGGATNANYMDAAWYNAIPTAFLIGPDSKIAWIGHPGSIQ